jgi:hypothetical protein
MHGQTASRELASLGIAANCSRVELSRSARGAVEILTQAATTVELLLR